LIAFVPIMLSSYAMSALYALGQTISIILNVDFPKLERFRIFYMCLDIVLPKLITTAHKEPLSDEGGNACDKTQSVHKVVRAHTFIATQVNNLAVMMTFGLCSPYVAAAVAVSAIAYYRRCVGLLWYYSTMQATRNVAVASNNRDFRNDVLKVKSLGHVLGILNNGFFQFWRLSSRKVCTFATTTSALIMGLLLFDLSADGSSERSGESSIYFVAAAILALILFLIGKFCIGDAYRKFADDVDTIHRSATVMRPGPNLDPSTGNPILNDRLGHSQL
jgi:hypothetical protein